MVASELQFPKADGDIIYDGDWNKGTYRIFTAIEQEMLSVTTSTGSVSYSAERDFHIIQNIGSVACFVNFDEAATTSDYKIEAYSEAVFETNATAIHAITSSGTTTLRIIGQK